MLSGLRIMARAGPLLASALVTLLGLGFNFALTQQKLNDANAVFRTELTAVVRRVDTIDNEGTRLWKLQEWKLDEHEKNIAELRSDQRSNLREISDIKIQLSSINTKLDGIQKSLDSLSKKP